MSIWVEFIKNSHFTWKTHNHDSKSYTITCSLLNPSHTKTLTSSAITHVHIHQKCNQGMIKKARTYENTTMQPLQSPSNQIEVRFPQPTISIKQSNAMNKKGLHEDVSPKSVQCSRVLVANLHQCDGNNKMKPHAIYVVTVPFILLSRTLHRRPNKNGYFWGKRVLFEWITLL